MTTIRKPDLSAVGICRLVKAEPIKPCTAAMIACRAYGGSGALGSWVSSQMQAAARRGLLQVCFGRTRSLEYELTEKGEAAIALEDRMEEIAAEIAHETCFGG